jgi:molybdopterin converting factor small subunit
LPLKVKLHGRIRTAVGSDEIELPGAVNTAGELLEGLVRKLGPDVSRYIFDPGTNEMSPTLVLLVNGHSIKMLEGLRTTLVERDTISIDSVDIMEIVGGG